MHIMSSEIRKSFWMILGVLLFAAVGSTAAHADTLLCGGTTVCSPGGYVTEIEDLIIGSNAFNVTVLTHGRRPVSVQYKQ